MKGDEFDPYFILCTVCSCTVVMEGERCVLDRLEEEAKRERTRQLLADGQSLDVVSQITVIPCSKGSTCLRAESGDTSQFDINGICTRFNDSHDSKYMHAPCTSPLVECVGTYKLNYAHCTCTHCYICRIKFSLLHIHRQCI